MSSVSREALLKDVRKVESLMEQRNHTEARELALEVRSKGSAVGIRSAFITWVYAVACDYPGQLEDAYHAVKEALTLDPLSLPFDGSMKVVLGRIREALLSSERSADDASTERLYLLLLEAGAADESSHCAYAAHLVAVGRLDHAFKVLQSVTTLTPRFEPGWKLLADVAKELGKGELVAEAKSQSTVLRAGGEPYTFACRARAEA